MNSYVILAVGWGVFLGLHSLLAATKVKKWMGEHRYYRLAYNVIATLGLFALIGFMMVIPPVWLLPKNTITQFVGLMLATYGIIVFRAAAKQYNWRIFFGVKSSSKEELNQKGILQYVRHPLYLALILVFTGYFFFAPSLSTLVAWGCTMFYLPFGIALEEKKLIAQFGATYQTYQKNVPMLIPKRGFFRWKKK